MVNVLDYLGIRSYGSLMTKGNGDADRGEQRRVKRRHPFTHPHARARGAYAQAIRAELEAIGVDDLPRNGAGRPLWQPFGREWLR